MNGVPVGAVEGGQVFFIRTDHIGRRVFATNDLGVKVWEAYYLPIGGVQTATGGLDLRFPGQWFQSESGLHQNWMRDYDPTTGRYIQADPLGLVDGASVYGYALQNPGRYVDPRGERGVPGGVMGQSFGLVRPPVGYGNPYDGNPYQGPWSNPNTSHPNSNAAANENQCSRNSCHLKTEVTPEQMKRANLGVQNLGPTELKGCLYSCPLSGKIKLIETSVNFSCPKSVEDNPITTYNDLNSWEQNALRIAGVKF
jgi:RHS repeat-associated protein